jgi:hypothetical protein
MRGGLHLPLADADERLRRAYEVRAGAPHGRGPVSGQQLAAFSKRLPEFPDSDQKRAISAMPLSRLSISV